jgi:hypothetical protein
MVEVEPGARRESASGAEAPIIDLLMHPAVAPLRTVLEDGRIAIRGNAERSSLDQGGLEENRSLSANLVPDDSGALRLESLSSTVIYTAVEDGVKRTTTMTKTLAKRAAGTIMFEDGVAQNALSQVPLPVGEQQIQQSSSQTVIEPLNPQNAAHLLGYLHGDALPPLLASSR